VQRNTAIWNDIIDENALKIGNDGRAAHHRTRDGQDIQSIMAQTLVNRTITKWSILADDHAT
jgi:hypothetical protein